MIDLLSLYSPSQAFALKSCNLHNLNKNLLTTLDTGGKLIHKHYMRGTGIKKNHQNRFFFFSIHTLMPTITTIVEEISVLGPKIRNFSPSDPSITVI